MPTTKKSGKKKTAHKKTATKKKPAKKGSKAGGSGGNSILPSNDPIIITGGGSVRLQFNDLKLRGNGGNRRDAAADLDEIMIINPPNPLTTIPLSRTAVIKITFK
ncbi:MAG: hypothetical protein QOJ02_2161 [Acidobacteriota bacterium]|jgi:hypothetical protein|nr:hypothetical protein [Acidobacteriota bacterium]